MPSLCAKVLDLNRPYWYGCRGLSLLAQKQAQNRTLPNTLGVSVAPTSNHHLWQMNICNWGELWSGRQSPFCTEPKMVGSDRDIAWQLRRNRQAMTLCSWGLWSSQSILNCLSTPCDLGSHHPHLQVLLKAPTKLLKVTKGASLNCQEVAQTASTDYRLPELYIISNLDILMCCWMMIRGLMGNNPNGNVHCNSRTDWLVMFHLHYHV